MLRDVTSKITDGLLGLSSAKGDGLHVKIGASPVTATAPVIVTGDMSAAQIRQRLGLSPLADAAMDSVAYGAGKIYCIPVAASTAGTAGEVAKTGTGSGTLTVTGSPNNAFAVVVKITGKGRLNTALFAYSINGGYSYSEDLTIPLSGAYDIPDTGLKLTFAEGTPPETSFLVDDRFAFEATAPVMTNNDVIGAINHLKIFGEEYEFVHIVGESALGLWQAVGAAQIELQNTYKKPMFFVLEAYKPNAEEDIADYGQRLADDRKKIRNYNLQVVTARGMLIRMDGVTQDVNLAGVVSGLYARAKVQTSIGKTRPEAGFGIPKTALLELRPAEVEAIIEQLDLAGYLTFREYGGLDDYFVYHPKMLSPDGSDYRYAEDVRVLNKIVRETRKEGLQLLQDDIDLEDVQGELETRAKFMFAPLQRMIDDQAISAAEITVPEGQAATILEDETMRVNVRYLSRGYIREVEIDIGRAQPDN